MKNNTEKKDWVSPAIETLNLNETEHKHINFHNPDAIFQGFLPLGHKGKHSR